MIEVNFSDGGYKISPNKIREIVRSTLTKNKIEDAIVDIAIVDSKKMDELNKKYYKGGRSLSLGGEDREHPIFTFVYDLEIFGARYLGEMVINYPMALETAKEEKKAPEEVVCELAEHGALHLAGIHHD
jgi:rRNA maturation RNase YbeY